jgi:hypothetical protein
MEYNTQLDKLILPEYGRNIQKMVQLVTAEPDREKRNKMANAIIEIMQVMNPAQRDVEDFKHKLWDHIFILSDYKLDVDAPYPKPVREEIEKKPRKVNYPGGNIKYMHYGKVVEKFIERAKQIEQPEKRMLMAELTANLMKKDYLAWNRDAVSDETILQHLEKMSGGVLKFEESKRLQFVDFRTKNVTNGNTSKEQGKNFQKKKKKRY